MEKRRKMSQKCSFSLNSHDHTIQATNMWFAALKAAANALSSLCYLEWTVKGMRPLNPLNPLIPPLISSMNMRERQF